MADEETQVDEIEPVDEKPSGRNWLVIVLSGLVGVLLLAFGLAAGYIVGQTNGPAMVAAGGLIDGAADGIIEDGAAEESEAEADEEQEELAEAIYFKLRPAFTVNFHDGQKERYLMADLDVMARDKEVIDQLEKDLSVVRYQVLRVLGRQDKSLFEEDGKDRLLAQVLEAIQGVVDSPAGEIEAVYLTSFVVQ